MTNLAMHPLGLTRGKDTRVTANSHARQAGHSLSPRQEVRHEERSLRADPGGLRMPQRAQRVSGNVSHTCRFFGVSRSLYYIWKERCEKNCSALLRTRQSGPRNLVQL